MDIERKKQRNTGQKQIVKKRLTLLFVHQHPNVLLGFKKRGFGSGKWNGFGGKVEEGEMLEDAAAREAYEEAGIEVEEVVEVGKLTFTYNYLPDVYDVVVFKAYDYYGDPVETDEMKPQWFGVDEIPFETMWPDARYWYPLVLEERYFRGKFELDAFNNVLSYSLMYEE
jgi:8-oxo-dGTP diphosphatase/2-hydroxy-dATP diphosphatase